MRDQPNNTDKLKATAAPKADQLYHVCHSLSSVSQNGVDAKGSPLITQGVASSTVTTSQVMDHNSHAYEDVGAQSTCFWELCHSRQYSATRS